MAAAARERDGAESSDGEDAQHPHTDTQDTTQQPHEAVSPRHRGAAAAADMGMYSAHACKRGSTEYAQSISQ